MSSRTNFPLYLAACALLAVCAAGLLGAARWIDRPFAGFLVLENRVVASATVPGWPATAGGEIYQYEVVSFDGVALERPEQLRDHAASLPPGTPVHYRFRSGDREIERAIRTRRFAPADFGLLFGVYLFNGWILGGAALALLAWGRGSNATQGFAPLLLISALWALSAMDLYGPYRLFRLHALFESLLFAGALHLGFGLGKVARSPGSQRVLVGGTWASAAALAAVYQLALHDPDRYVQTHLLATSAAGAALLSMVALIGWRRLRSASPQVRQGLAILAPCAALSLLVPIAVMIGEVLTGGSSPQNGAGVTAFLFPIAIGFALWRGDLLLPGRLAPQPDERPARTTRPRPASRNPT